MGQIDEPKERQRLAELYAGMEDGELEVIAADADSLTRMATEALRSELLKRGMQALPAERESADASGSLKTPGRDRDVPRPVMIARYWDTPKALLAKSMLDSAGIESFLIDENLVRMAWPSSNLVDGIKLTVRAQDAETARKLLEEKTPEKLDVPGVGEYAQPRCPRCGSLDVGFDEMDKQGAHAAMAVLGVLLTISHKGGTCHACGHEWQYDAGPSLD